MPEDSEEHPGHSTGPRSPDGKERSSQNSTKHGCRSRRVIVGDERQEDFDALSAGWMQEFSMEGQAGESLLEPLILNDWLLRRAMRNYLEVESALAEIHPMEWTDEHHKKLQLFLRYKTSAERSFYRSWSALRGLRKDLRKIELSVQELHSKVEELAKEMARLRERTQPKAAAKKRYARRRGGDEGSGAGGGGRCALVTD